MHATLTAKNNLRLIVVWLVAAVVVAFFFARPLLWVPFVVGALVGVAAGICQLRALHEAADSLLVADSALAVRRALKQSGWGKASIAILWLGVFVIAVISAFLFGPEMLPGFVVGYAGLGLARELTALPGVFALARLPDPGEPKA